jgi:hypothetical protein
MTEHQALTNVKYTKTRLNSQSDVLSRRVYCHSLFGMKNIFHRMSHEKLSAGERRGKAGKNYYTDLKGQVS